MKRHFFITLLTAMVCIALVSNVKAQNSEFLSVEQIKKDIETHYSEVFNKMLHRLSLLEIRNHEKNSNYMYVYFLENQDPDLAKDVHGNIYSGAAITVKVAVYAYSYLTNTWRLQRIDNAPKGSRFKVD